MVLRADLDRAEKAGAKDARSAAQHRLTLGALLLDLDRPSDAVEMLDRAHRGLHAFADVEAKIRDAEALRLLGLAYGRVDDVRRCERALLDAIALGTKAASDHHEVVLEAKIDLGELYADGHFEDKAAEPLLTRVLAATDDAGLELLETRVRALRALAIVLEDEGRLDEAHELFRRALGAQTVTLGADAPPLAATLLDLARLDARQKHGEEADTHLARALSIVGDGDPAECARMESSVAEVFHAVGDDARAIELLDRAKMRLEQSASAEELDILELQTRIEDLKRRKYVRYG
jgi:tetratricopeptide (TPR) repeat protein